MQILTFSSSLKMDFVSGMIEEFVSYVSPLNILVALTDGFNVFRISGIAFRSVKVSDRIRLSHLASTETITSIALWMLSNMSYTKFHLV